MKLLDTPDFIIQLWSTLRQKEVLATRIDALTNGEVRTYSQEIGMILGGKLTLTVEFDGRLSEEQSKYIEAMVNAKIRELGLK